MNSEHLQMLFLDAIANVIPCYIKQLCILQRALYIYIIQKIKNGNKETKTQLNSRRRMTSNRRG